MQKKVLEILVIKNGGILEPADLPGLCKKIENIAEKIGWNNLFVISGRLPLWAAAAITHTLHPSIGVAIYEPRRNAAIIVMSHVADSKIGDIVNIDDAQIIEVKYE